jgi:hypothetical protein
MRLLKENNTFRDKARHQLIIHDDQNKKQWPSSGFLANDKKIAS